MRKIVLDRLGDLEQDEVQMEQDLLEADDKLEDMLEELDDAATLNPIATPHTEINIETEITEEETSFMSASIYEKFPLQKRNVTDPPAGNLCLSDTSTSKPAPPSKNFKPTTT